MSERGHQPQDPSSTQCKTRFLAVKKGKCAARLAVLFLVSRVRISESERGGGVFYDVFFYDAFFYDAFFYDAFFYDAFSYDAFSMTLFPTTLFSMTLFFCDAFL